MKEHMAERAGILRNARSVVNAGTSWLKTARVSHKFVLTALVPVTLFLCAMLAFVVLQPGEREEALRRNQDSARFIAQLVADTFASDPDPGGQGASRLHAGTVSGIADAVGRFLAEERFRSSEHTRGEVGTGGVPTTVCIYDAHGGLLTRKSRPRPPEPGSREASGHYHVMQVLRGRAPAAWGRFIEGYGAVLMTFSGPRVRTSVHGVLPDRFRMETGHETKAIKSTNNVPYQLNVIEYRNGRTFNKVQTSWNVETIRVSEGAENWLNHIPRHAPPPVPAALLLPFPSPEEEPGNNCPEIRKGVPYVTHQNESGAIWHEYKINDQPVDLFYHPVLINDSETVGHVLLIKEQLKIEPYSRVFLSITVGGFLLIVVCFGVLALYLARTIAHPLHELAGAALETQNAPDRARVFKTVAERPDEIGVLARSLADMTSELEGRIQRRKMYASTLFHSFKSPIEGMAICTELVEEDIGHKDYERAGRNINRLKASLNNMRRIAERVVSFESLEADINAEERETRTVTQWIELYRLNKTKMNRVSFSVIEADDMSGVQLCTCWRFFDMIFDELVANAQNFVEERGALRMVFFKEPEFVRISVENSGTGIEQEDMERIFDPFRSIRPGEPEHSHHGIGLAGCREIIRSLGGTIHAENVTGTDETVTGVRFVVRHPRAPDRSGKGAG
ncbi:MAG: HAMP domain-containing sensor histidine kinase [Alphaproteobacteria bacterium]|nr:HAMP domain-containing sensor histidine kinase [Alphaproteobacteria bacterium]